MAAHEPPRDDDLRDELDADRLEEDSSDTAQPWETCMAKRNRYRWDRWSRLGRVTTGRATGTRLVAFVELPAPARG
jgi:hypothetical protein